MRVVAAKSPLALDSDRRPTFARAALDGRRSTTALVFLLLRHQVSLPFARLMVAAPRMSKSKLGSLRVVDCLVLGSVIVRVLVRILRQPRVQALDMLSRTSLQVFAARIPVGVLPDALIGPPYASVSTVLAQCTRAALMLSVARFAAWRSDRSQWPIGAQSGGSRASESAISYVASHRTESSLGPSN